MTTDFRPLTSDTSRPFGDKPLISIIVPSYNQGAFIRETLDSILRQDYRPMEVLIIDGASTDGTLDVLHQYDSVPEVTWISEPDSGQIEAVNKGFAMARGEICAIQSSDDFYMPGVIKKGIQELLNNPAIGLVFGDMIKIDVGGNEIMKEVLMPFSIENILSCRTWIPQCSCFFRLSLAKELGGWRESVPYAADTDLWMRILLKSSARKIDVFMAKRRVHPSQRDVHGDRIIRDYSQVIKDLFEIFDAPSHLRPAAEAGILMVKNRYNYGEEEKVKIQRLRKAIQLYPPLKNHIRFPSRVPGVDYARAFIRRMRDKVLGAD